MEKENFDDWNIALKLEALWRDIRAAALRAGRKSEEIQLVLASKTVSAERLREATDAGHRRFGENRAQELASKKMILPGDVEWHMIGHLQTNKVKNVVGNTALIHSLDRFELAEVIDAVAVKKNVGCVDCLIQVNSSGEASKFGFDPGDVFKFVKKIPGSSRVRIRGLMTIGPHTEDPEKIRKAFKLTNVLRQDLMKSFPENNWNILSMGMSGDYEIAIEEGSTLLRVGSRVFGKRTKVERKID